MQMSESQELVLYHSLLSSYSQKTVLALDSLSLKYESRFVNLGAAEQLEPWYLDLNPKGEVPTLRDGDVVLTDSADIIQYLNDTYDTRSKPSYREGISTWNLSIHIYDLTSLTWTNESLLSPQVYSIEWADHHGIYLI